MAINASVTCQVVKSKVENKGRGYGFVSFLDPMDCAKAIREMNNKYLGTRPMKIRKSTWKDRDIEEARITLVFMCVFVC